MKINKVLILMPIGLFAVILAVVFSFTQASNHVLPNNLENLSEQNKNANSTTTTHYPAPEPVAEIKPLPDSPQDPLPPPPQASEPNPVSPVQPSPDPAVSPISKYTLHRNITATVFWVGEPQGNGSSEDNALSSWDDAWMEHFGGYDDPANRNGYYPVGFTPKENPFYLDLPYNDFNDNGQRKASAFSVVPWAGEKGWQEKESLMKNRWVKLIKGGSVCYGQIQDAGPYEYDDVDYVFGTSKPKNIIANSAGLDVSPALRDCLGFSGINNADNQVDWQFVDAKNVPSGPWSDIITTSQIFWP